MTSIILGQAASALGGAIGGPIASGIAMGLGSVIGRHIDNNILLGKSSYKVSGSKLSDLSVQTSLYGKMIPCIYGTCRVAGNIIWSLPIREEVNTHSSGGGKFGGGEVLQTQFSYYATLAIALCEGPIDSIVRVWANNKILDPSKGKYRVYKGDEGQLPDSLIEAHEGIGKTPAYRGLAYVVIEDLPLAEFGNHIPNLTFEIKKRMIKIEDKKPLEEKIESMVIIPGSGEFVYDTKVQSKISGNQVGDKFIQQGTSKKINLNNHFNKADALCSLDQLQETCQNIKWVAPVVGWFADSLKAGEANLMPGVEYKDGNTTSPDQWQVSNYSRQSGYEISKDKRKNPVYGGTTSDSSILNYLSELKNREYKVMFYPMFFVDVKGKPWRGRMTGEPEDIKIFFVKYNKFILHYAELVKGKVDAFVIGSELIGLTKVKDGNKFTAVDELVKLAKQVKKILGKDVVVTYAADWSEYHHTDGGWFNLDKLWACDAVDVIGIDSYFPLTESATNSYNADEIRAGWTKGEGYDYYYHGDGKRTLGPAYAWKDIHWWWSKKHYNPDGKPTGWKPKSKKIWFTEFGFPSVDCASNQPNVFYDPKSTENGFPKLSKGRTDFRAQRAAIEATLDQWQDSKMIEKMFLWTWDARPYPYWPDLLDVWSDGGCWSKGHWVNGKLGISSLGAIIAELCKKSGLKDEDFDVSQLTVIYYLIK